MSRLVPRGAAVRRPSHAHGRPELRRLGRGGAAGIVGLAVNALFGFVFLKIVGDQFPQTSAGAIYVALAVLLIVVFAAPLGADVGLLRFMPVFRHSHRRREPVLLLTAQVPPLLVGIAVALLAVRYAPEFARIAVRSGNRSLVAQELRYLMPFLPLAALMSTALAGARAWSIRSAVLVANVLVPVARCAVLFALSLAGRVTPVSVALAWGLPLAAGAVLSVAIVWKKALADRAPAGITEPTSDGLSAVAVFRDFWTFCSARSIQAVFQIAVVYLDVVLVSALASTRSAASYNIASRYTFLGTAAAQGIAFAIAPQLSSLLHRRQHAAASSAFRAGAVWIVLLSWPLLFLLAEFSSVFMGVFGTAYRAGDAALTIVALALLVQTGTGTNGVALNMGGKSVANMLIGGLAVVVNIGANVILIPRMGLNGAAVAWLVTVLVTQIATSIVLYRTVRLQPFGSGYRFAALAAVVCFGVVGAVLRTVGGATPWMLAATVGYGGLLYLWLLSQRRQALRLTLLPVIGPRLR